MKFIQIDGYNLLAATTGHNKGRILVFKSTNNDSGQWTRITGTQIIVAGQNALAELTRLVQNNGRPAANKLIPGGIAGRAYPALRKTLLTSTNTTANVKREKRKVNER